jgi:MFS family permease
MAATEPPPTPAAPRPDPYAAWRIPNYRLYAGSWLLMTMARQIEFLAIGIYLYGPTKDLLALGWQGFVMALPAVLLAIPGGHLADRFDRRWVLAVTLTVTLLVSGGLAMACNSHRPALWIYLLLIINAVAQALGSPSRTALMPWIVPPDRFANAVAWSTTVFQISTMVGPVAGGYLIWLFADRGVPTALVSVTVLRFLSLAGIMLLPVRRRDPEREQSSISWEALAAGIRFVWTQKPILATISLDLFAVLLGGATFVLPAFADQVLGYHTQEQMAQIAGYLRSAEAAGAIGMAVLLAHLPPIRKAGWTMLWAVAGFGVATVGLGLSQWLAAALVAMFALGALDNISVVVRHTMIQLLTPDNMRGRVTAVNNVFIVASNELGGMESGIAASLFGLVPSIIGGGIGAILVVVGCAALWPQILTIGSLADLRPADEAIVRQETDEEIAAR